VWPPATAAWWGWVKSGNRRTAPGLTNWRDAPACGVISARDFAEDFGTLLRQHEALGRLAFGQ